MMVMMMMMTMTAMMSDLTLDAEKYLVCSWKMSHRRSGGAAEFEEAAKPKRDKPSFFIFFMCPLKPQHKTAQNNRRKKTVLKIIAHTCNSLNASQKATMKSLSEV